MGNLDYKTFARRHRPHFQPFGSTLFVTYRLAGSIPKSIVRDYREKKLWLDNQVVRAHGLARDDNAPELKKWLERLETFTRLWFMKFEEILHHANCGPLWLKDERLAERVADNLHRLDGINYRLDAYSIMSNHVHTVFKPIHPEKVILEEETLSLSSSSAAPGLSRIMHSVKGRSARECNLLLSRSGSFWEHESFDHVIRSGKFAKTIKYVLNNPVKAQLVSDWRDWRWNYCRKELSDNF
jgi:putative transposase